MKIQAKNTIDKYIQCYAPLNTRMKEGKDELFDRLHDTLADIPSTQQIYLMGYDNGTVGNERRMYTDYWDHTVEELGTTMEKDVWIYVQVTT